MIVCEIHYRCLRLLDKLNKDACLVIQHFLSYVAKRPNNFSAKRLAFALDSNWDGMRKIPINSSNRYAQGYIRGQLTIKLHITVQADAADDAVASIGIFPKWVTKLSHFSMR